MQRFSISLRNLQTKNVPITEKLKVPGNAPTNRCYLSDRRITNAVSRFVKKLNDAVFYHSIASKCDIYISLYGNQGDLILPPSFFRLVNDLNIKVIIDYNS